METRLEKHWNIGKLQTNRSMKYLRIAYSSLIAVICNRKRQNMCLCSVISESKHAFQSLAPLAEITMYMTVRRKKILLLYSVKQVQGNW